MASALVVLCEEGVVFAVHVFDEFACFGVVPVVHPFGYGLHPCDEQKSLSAW